MSVKSVTDKYVTSCSNHPHNEQFCLQVFTVI